MESLPLVVMHPHIGMKATTSHAVLNATAEHKFMEHNFKFKITDAELEKILIQHLIVEGQITEREVPLLKTVERRGRNTMVEFGLSTSVKE